jgi:hypothetical protein
MTVEKGTRDLLSRGSSSIRPTCNLRSNLAEDGMEYQTTGIERIETAEDEATR